MVGGKGQGLGSLRLRVESSALIEFEGREPQRNLLLGPRASQLRLKDVGSAV